MRNKICLEMGTLRILPNKKFIMNEFQGQVEYSRKAL